MQKMPRRRFTDKIRELADEAWDRGNKDLATALHDQAHLAEIERNDVTAKVRKKRPQA